MYFRLMLNTLFVDTAMQIMSIFGYDNCFLYLKAFESM